MVYFGSNGCVQGPAVQLYINHPVPDKSLLVSDQPAPLAPSDRLKIEAAGGNNYRKVFNIYSKLSFFLEQHFHVPRVAQITQWQAYRDQFFLDAQAPCRIAFLSDDAFAHLNRQGVLPTSLCEQVHEAIQSEHTVHLFSGKKCANAFGLSERCFWLNEHFAQVTGANALVTPYFDYRQLSNLLLERLQQLLITRL